MERLQEEEEEDEKLWEQMEVVETKHSGKEYCLLRILIFDRKE